MARRKARPVAVNAMDDVVEEYRLRLAEPARFAELEWTPQYIGPTWQTTDDGQWLLPERTLGWEVLGWTGVWLQHGRNQPWRYTLEQARFVLWWFAVDDTGRFLFHDGVLQRLKGWGKDPLGATLCATELLGPCRFAEFDDDGQPLAVDEPNAWVQTAAVALDQTKNTMRLFPSLFTPEAVKKYRLQVGKELIHGMNDERLLEAVTSSPTRLEGARATFLLLNETQHWDDSNGGHDMSQVISRNAAKSPDGAARTLRITNAYEPGRDSVGQRDREAFESIEAGRTRAIGLLYDSLEAPPDAPLTAEAVPSVVKAVRGDSEWLDADHRILNEILDPRNSPSTSRRFWYNQITATEDAWVAPAEWDACADTTIVVEAKAMITLGFDGSKSDDHSALIGCDVEQDHLFEIGVWFPQASTGEVDRADIDRQVRATFELYDVVGFFSDLHPWESYVDDWAQDLGEGLVLGSNAHHKIAFDIRGRTKEFTLACERLHSAILASHEEAVLAGEEHRDAERRLTQCGSARFRQHVHNARRAPNQWGVSVRKEHRESAKKIDSVPAAVLARLARQKYLALPESKRRKPKRSGVVW